MTNEIEQIIKIEHEILIAVFCDSCQKPVGVSNVVQFITTDTGKKDGMELHVQPCECKTK